MKYLARILIILIVVGFFSCEKEEECVGCNLNPKIKLKFEAAGTRDIADSILKEVNEKIIIFMDSLNSELSAEAKNSIIEELTLLRIDSAKYDGDLSLFQVGRTKMQSITAIGSLGFEQFQDSIIRNFSIPIDMHHDTSTYYFSYHELVDTLQVYYQRDVTQTFDGVRMRISGIGVNEEMSTFDSIRVKCYNRECSNDITAIYVYY